MLQYVSRDATLFIRSFVKTSVCFFVVFFFLFGKLWSCSVVQHWGWYWVWSSYKMASIMLSERCHLECVIRSPFLSQKCVSAMLSQFAQKTEKRKEKKKSQSDSCQKMWSEFQEAALVTTWGADHVIFLNSWLTSGLSLVTPKISFKLSIRVTPVAYVAPASNLCLPVTDSSLERRRMLET